MAQLRYSSFFDYQLLRGVDFVNFLLNKFITNVLLDLIILPVDIYWVGAEVWIALMSDLFIPARNQEENEAPIAKQADRARPLQYLEVF